jgi:peptidoglycan glycosyltransferase
MRRRIIVITYAFIIVFLILAVQEARIQIVDRAAIQQRAGDPRRAQSLAHRGELLDATGLPLAQSKGSRRIYSAGPALAHVVGYSSSVYGESGLESSLDSILSPRDPSSDQFTGLGSLFGQRKQQPKPAGGKVILTLRRDIAQAVDQALPANVRGAVVVLDPRTGAVLAAVNRPTFNPNRLAADWSKLRSRADSPLLDRSFDGLYPPGSTFKMLTASAALDSGTFSVDDGFRDPGYFNIGNFTVHNAEGEASGYQSLVGAFAHSSNVDFAQIGLKLGVDTFYQYLHRFRVGDDAALSLPVSRDEIPPANSVSDGELAQMSFGQGSLAVTPLRMALIAATIANGGSLMRPLIVKEFQPAGRPPIRTVPVNWGTPISKPTADAVREMMIDVVKYGTGTAAGMSNVVVAGKTGTATHPGGAPDAWFVCFAPARAPRLVVAVVIEDAGYGGAVAAPIARNILAATLPLYAQ